MSGSHNRKGLVLVQTHEATDRTYTRTLGVARIVGIALLKKVGLLREDSTTFDFLHLTKRQFICIFHFVKDLRIYFQAHFTRLNPRALRVRLNARRSIRMTRIRRMLRIAFYRKRVMLMFQSIATFDFLHFTKGQFICFFHLLKILKVNFASLSYWSARGKTLPVQSNKIYSRSSNEYSGGSLYPSSNSVGVALMWLRFRNCL